MVTDDDRSGFPVTPGYADQTTGGAIRRLPSAGLTGSSAAAVPPQ